MWSGGSALAEQPLDLLGVARVHRRRRRRGGGCGWTTSSRTGADAWTAGGGACRCRSCVNRLAAVLEVFIFGIESSLGFGGALRRWRGGRGRWRRLASSVLGVAAASAAESGARRVPVPAGAGGSATSGARCRARRRAVSARPTAPVRRRPSVAAASASRGLARPALACRGRAPWSCCGRRAWACGFDLADRAPRARRPRRGSSRRARGGTPLGPRNMIVTLTLWPSFRNSATLRVLVSKSPRPILGRYFISLMEMFDALAT